MLASLHGIRAVGVVLGRVVGVLIVLLGTCGWGSPGYAAWPDRAIRILVPYPAGGNADSLARLVGEALSRDLKTTVVIENKPGGTGQVATESVSRATPDGYTLLLGTSSFFTTFPILTKLDYKPIDLVDIVGGVAGYVPVLAVSNSLGVSSLGELVELARQNPGELTFGSVGVGAASHINGEILKKTAGIDMLHVPFKGSAQGLNALIGGQIDVLIDGVTVTAAKSRRVTPLATFYRSRHSELPDLPTVIEAGVPVRISSGPTFGIFAPKGLPPEIMHTLRTALEQVVNASDMKVKMGRISLVSDWTASDDFRKALDEDLAFNQEFLRAIGLVQGE